VSYKAIKLNSQPTSAKAVAGNVYAHFSLPGTAFFFVALSFGNASYSVFFQLKEKKTA
jgi:hypothetical protein